LCIVDGPHATIVDGPRARDDMPGSTPRDRPASARRADHRERTWTVPSPAERAARHAAKIQARASRETSVPGPGSYSTNGRTPRGGSSLQTTGGGRAAFRSKSLQRLKTSNGGDPGAYNAADAADAMSTSSFSVASSFSRAARAGNSGFGVGARDLRLDHSGEDTPGPGAYGLKLSGSMSGGGLFAARTTMPSAAFRSLSAQRPNFHAYGAHSPPSSSVRPQFHVVEARVRDGMGAVMRSRSQRFAIRQTTGEYVAPNTYNPRNELFGRRETEESYGDPGTAMSRMRGSATRDAPGTPAFRSESVRELRFPTTPIW